MYRSHLLAATALLLLGTLTASSFAAAADPADEAEHKAASAVFTAYNKMLASHFAIDITSTDDKGVKSKAFAEYEGLSRIRMKTPQMEVITTPEGTWVRAGEEGWSRPPVDMAGMVKQFVPKSAAELQASSSNVKDEGPTTWQGKPAHAYSYDVDLQVMGANVHSHNNVIIDANGLMVRSESDGAALGRKSHTVQEIRYGDDIKVVAPKS